MPTPPFQFDPLASYDVLPEERGDIGPSRLIAGRLFISRHGTVDLLRALGEVREHVLYLSETDVPIGRLQGDQLILARTGAIFTLSLRHD